jgi:hypothetical protein
MNLHDYISQNRDWQQLWTDDQIAIWFETTNSKQYPYEVFTAIDHLLSDDCVMIVSQAFCKDLSEAFDIWNGHINKHIDLVRA